LSLLLTHEADTTAHNLTPINTAIAAYNAHAANTTTAHGINTIVTNVAAVQSEVTTARGSQASLNARLATALSASGTILLANMNNKWITPGDVPTYIDATHFSVPGDRRVMYIAGANLRFTVSGQYQYGTVTSSSYAGGITTVTCDPCVVYTNLTSGLSQIDFALIAFDNTLATSIATLNASLTTLTAQVNSHQLQEVQAYQAAAPAASQVVLSYVASRAATLPVNLSGSQAKAATAATASATFTVTHNGTNVGTLVFAAAGTVPTLTMASAQTLAAGDTITVIAPATPDATLAKIAFNLQLLVT